MPCGAGSPSRRPPVVVQCAADIANDKGQEHCGERHCKKHLDGRQGGPPNCDAMPRSPCLGCEFVAEVQLQQDHLQAQRKPTLTEVTWRDAISAGVASSHTFELCGAAAGLGVSITLVKLPASAVTSKWAVVGSREMGPLHRRPGASHAPMRALCLSQPVNHGLTMSQHAQTCNRQPRR